MSDDNIKARPSLFLAKHEKAHREHLHQHHLFHNYRRQTGDSAVQSVVTEVVATVSVVQQVDVDSNGSVYATETIAVVTGGAGPAETTGTDESSSPTTTTGAASPAPTDQISAAGNTALGGLSSSQSLSNSSGASAATTSALSIPAYASLTASNTTLISSSTLGPNYANSSRSSTASLSSVTYLSSTDGVISMQDFSSSTSYDSYTTSSSSYSSQSTTSSSVTGVIVGGTATDTGSVATSTPTSGNDNNNSTSTVSTPAVVGGVVGGVAGAAIIIFLLMFLIRWKKRNSSMLLLGNGDGTEGYGTRNVPPSQPSGGMSQRRSFAQVVPAALASLTGHNKRASQKTERTISSTAGSERGFYRVSGRKLPSVLQTGGDGYGGPDEATWSGGSFYRDSQGFYGGRPGGPGPSSHGNTIPEMPLSPPIGVSPLRESGVPVMRPSPARTPVTEPGPFFPAPAAQPPPRRPGDQSPILSDPNESPHRPPRPRTFDNPFADPSDPLPPLRRPDHLGRSHPSQDGSHTSRFTEEV